MEYDQTTALFNLNVDTVTKAHLSETAKWARFLSVVGFVLLGLFLLGGIAVSLYSERPLNNYGGNAAFSAYGVGMSFILLFTGVIWFFPLLFLYRFASRMKTALNGNDQNALNTSFQNLKICFRYVGIITIIILALYALLLVFAIVGVAAFS
ncbi:DUF5362 family protein [Flavisolibacter tropicus]|nr:DUF5362 family protein [Flavisolibacter tropicus]